MHTLKKLLLPFLVVIVFVISNYNPASIFAQYNGTTTLITYGTRQLQWDGGNEQRITPDGRYIVFLSGYYEGPEKTQVFLYDRVLNTTELVSVNANGDAANWNIYDVDISNDGQLIAYSTYAYNLDTPDTNNLRDIYVLNRQTGQTTRVSVDSAGLQANNQSTDVFISGNGQVVAFSSDATNLIGTDTNGLTDVYVHDRQTAQTTRVSVDSAGTQANAASAVKGISNDGRYVLFQSDATNLVANDTNNVTDVFVHDRQTAQTIRVSVSATGVQGNAESHTPSISGDGQRVAFLSEANSLIVGDTNFTADVYVRDLQANTVTRVNLNPSGGQASAPTTLGVYPTLSNNGRYVTFAWYAGNIVAGDTNGDYDVFVRDLQTNTSRLVSLTSAGTQLPYSDTTWYPSASVSDDGRYAIFAGTGNGFVPNDTNNKLDIFVRDTQDNTTTSVTVGNTSIAIDGALGNVFLPQVSGNGRYVAFSSKSPSLNPNGSSACFLFVYDHQTGTTTLASVNDAGQPHYIHPTACWGMYLSDDGRYLTFNTTEPFVTGDDANSLDFFIRDLQLGTTTRVGLTPLGTPLPTLSGGIELSGDARYIAFGSTSSTLVANDTNNKTDIFVYDNQTAQITRVSVDSAGNEANNSSTLYDMSSDARYILFLSDATNLVPNAASQGLYLHDRQTGQTIAASVDSTGNPKRGSSGRISDDGRFILFVATDSDIVPNDTNGVADLFLYDRQTGLVTRVSVSSFGVQGDKRSWSYGLSLSSDGNLIFFHSDATNLVPNDVNNVTDFFVHNRLTGQTTRLVEGTYRNPFVPVSAEEFSYSISDDGYTLAFSTVYNGVDPRDINFMSDVYLRVTPNELLDTPTLIAPADMALVNPPVEFSWNAVNGATDYRIQIATDSQFVNITLDKELTTNTYSLNGLTSGTYYWRVIAYNDTRTSLWSAPRQFTQETDSPLLAPPTLTAPANLTNLDYAPEDMTFTWDAINGVTSYQIQVSSNNTFATNLNINQLVNGTSYTDPNYAVLFPNTYYWRVRVAIEGVLYGEWSAVNQFTLLYTPPLQLISPANNFVTDVAWVDLKWERVTPTYSTGSQLQVARDADFTDIVETVNLLINSFGYGDYYTAGVYYWRVRPNSNGLWSEVRQFTVVPLPAPTLISPEDNAIGDGFVTLNWSAVPNGYYSVRRYQISVATDANFNNTVHWGNSTPETYLFTRNTVSQQSLDMTYYWRVRAIHFLFNSPGEWSEVRQFSLNPYPAPILTSPEAGATANTLSINFTWDAVIPDISLNRFQLAKDDQFTQLVINSTSYAETFTLTPEHDFLPGVYYWRVRMERGEWSEVRQVIINSPVSFIQPVDGALFTTPNTTITFSWNALSGTNWQYQLTCSKNANFTNPVINQTTSQTSFTYTFPTTTSQYYCRLVGLKLVPNYDTTVYSNTLTFTIYSETYDEAYTLNEQQLFNMAQPHLTGDMTFALFDITPTGILTTVQFGDGAVVTGNVLFVVQNGLITISIEGVSGGNADQQNAFYQELSALFMTVLTETLPDDFASVKTFSMTDSGLNITVVRPTELP